MKNDQAVLMIANSELDSNLYYATRFLAPDPFIFIQTDGRKTLVMSDLELDRARAQARVNEVLSYSAIEQKLKEQGLAEPKTIDVVDACLKVRGVRRLLIPGDFGFRHAQGLQSKGYALTTKPDPFFEERVLKSAEEIEAITQTQRATEAAVEAAVEVIRESKIKKDELHWSEGTLTSEAIKKIINVKLMEMDCIAQHTIVACGLQGCDPHDEGSGPLRPNQSIVMDVFPRSARTRYYADMTRTVVKGRAPDALRTLYDAVRRAQEEGIAMVRDGAEGRTIHRRIMTIFEQSGYPTGPKNGRMQGFFHGTGHGVGLDIHEPPRISKSEWTLKAGEVVTVEPGLYYPEIGAVRIEDLVVVTPTGCENLTRFPKVLEL
ncbi:MAG TPA: Xaa-Pro peptidase family protein [Nitrospiria bacterium]|nr:Xaa-Pro peptidase family protein [Nitrospiria bacterium]